jgi:hypothetical protein
VRNDGGDSPTGWVSFSVDHGLEIQAVGNSSYSHKIINIDEPISDKDFNQLPANYQILDTWRPYNSEQEDYIFLSVKAIGNPGDQEWIKVRATFDTPANGIKVINTPAPGNSRYEDQQGYKVYYIPVNIDDCLSDPNKVEPGTCNCGISDADSDNDGTVNCNDNCPNDPNKLSPGICGCGISDVDSDKDGTVNCNDICPNDPNKLSPGICGCGISDIDSDKDSTPDCNDNCPNDSNKVDPGACGCGISDIDSANGGTPDCNDNCPNDPDKGDPGTCGCGISDIDSDNDGTPNCNDIDDDGDKIPDSWEIQYNLNPLFDDALEDPDGDGYFNLEEYLGRSDPGDEHSLPKARSVPWIQLLLL